MITCSQHSRLISVCLCYQHHHHHYRTCACVWAVSCLRYSLRLLRTKNFIGNLSLPHLTETTRIAIEFHLSSRQHIVYSFNNNSPENIYFSNFLRFFLVFRSLAAVLVWHNKTADAIDLFRIGMNQNINNIRIMTNAHIQTTHEWYVQYHRLAREKYRMNEREMGDGRREIVWRRRLCAKTKNL